LEYDFESDFERLVESDSLLLSVATALSVVVVLAVRLADLLLESVNDKDLLDEAEASREADLLLDLLDAASREADWLADLLDEASSAACWLLDLLAAASREADWLLDLLAEASSEAASLLDLLAEASSEADLSLDLLAEASSEAFADLESVADRLASEDLLACAAALSLELLVPAEVPAVVLVPFVPEPPLVAVMLSAVVPVEAE
jgi:hypothetical protein